MSAGCVQKEMLCAYRTASRVAPRCRRDFSSSQSRKTIKTLPTFTESSTPELTTLLSTIRSRILLPGCLNRTQRSLIFRPENRTRLENDPFIITLGDEDVHLEPLNLFKDLPSRWKSFRAAVQLAETREDWENLMGVLKGYRFSGRVEEGWKEMFVRRAGLCRQQGVVLEALKQVEKTGLSLANYKVADLVMYGAHQIARNGEWEEEAVKRAARYARTVLGMLELKEHQSKASKGHNPKFRPTVIGAALEVVAVEAQKYSPEKKGEVISYSKRLLAALKSQGVTPVKSYKPFMTAHLSIMHWIPVWHGLTVARSFLGADMPNPEEADQWIAKLDQSTTEWMDNVKAETDAERGNTQWESELSWDACRNYQ